MLVLVKKSFFVVGKPVQHVGDIIELDDEHAKVLIKNNVVEEVKNEEPIEETTSNNIEYDELNVTKLKELLKERGLSTKGKKLELIERLKESDKL